MPILLPNIECQLAHPNPSVAVIVMESFLQILQTKEFGLLGFFLFLYLVFQWPKRSKTGAAKNPSPPEVAGAWPIIGHFHLLTGSKRPPHVTFAAMADKYGPAFMFRMGQLPTLILSDKELVKEFLTTKDTAALSRPKSIVGEHLGFNYAMFANAPYGPYWREMRKLISLEVLSNRRLQLLRHIRDAETQTSIKELYKLWDEKRNISSPGFALLTMNKWFGNITLNVILRMVVGKRYCGSIDASEEKEATRSRELIREYVHLNGIFFVSDVIPQTRWMDLGGYEKKLKKLGKDMEQMTDQWLKEHRQRKESAGNTNNGDHQKDFMDVMMSLMENAENAAGYDGDTIIKTTCLALISAGSDSTSATLIWALTLIINNPSVLKKAQEELDLKVGKNKLVEESDIANLVYLQAIIKEVLRLYPPGPMGGPREFTEDCTLGGYYIPKGTRLLINMWKLHRDPKYFPEPLKFMPERFLTTHKDIDVKGQHHELIPFSGGRRICPGVSFAQHLLHLVLASVLHAFDFATPDNEPIDMTETDGLINHKAIPLKLLVSPRLSPVLYN